MASTALSRWNTDRRAEIDRARQICATAPTRTRSEIAVAELHLVAYLAVCCAEFQAFCGELYRNAVDVISKYLAAADATGTPRTRDEVRLMLVNSLVAQTRLAAGNPTTSNLIKDFDRLSINLRASALQSRGPATAHDYNVLDVDVLATRNALFHGRARIGALASGSPPGPVTVARVDAWSGTLQRLATTMDDVVGRTLASAVSGPTW